jgi:hypothetical protein
MKKLGVENLMALSFKEKVCENKLEFGGFAILKKSEEEIYEYAK